MDLFYIFILVARDSEFHFDRNGMQKKTYNLCRGVHTRKICNTCINFMYFGNDPIVSENGFDRNSGIFRDRHAQCLLFAGAPKKRTDVPALFVARNDIMCLNSQNAFAGRFSAFAVLSVT